MAILIKYVVEHKGVEKLVTTDKKEADKYDKMLDIADNLAAYIEQKGIDLSEQVTEELSVLLAKNKDAVLRMLKGADAAQVLNDEASNDDNTVVDLEKKQA